MLTAVFDTETTGLPDFRAPYAHHSWPDCVQVGLVVLEDRYPIYETGFLICNPNAKSIEPGAQAVHGISMEMCRTYGYPVGAGITIVNEWFAQADRIVGHNLSFDYKVWMAHLHRNQNVPEGHSKPFRDKKLICTMMSSIKPAKVPNKHGTGNKWPKLDEAYRALVDPRGFPDAHNASADVWACIRVLWALEDIGAPLLEPSPL